MKGVMSWITEAEVDLCLGGVGRDAGNGAECGSDGVT